MQVDGGKNGEYRGLVPEDAHPQAPLVVLLGWVGAPDSPLRKYAERVAEWGYPSVRSVVPAHYVLTGLTQKCNEWAQNMLEFVVGEPLLAGRPVVMYAFSNGGAAIVTAAKRVSQASPDPKLKAFWPSVIACTFDSAPIIGGKPANRYVVASTIQTSFLDGLRWRARLFLDDVKTTLAHNSFYEDFECECTDMLLLGGGENRLPMLYLFSTADVITPACELQGLLERKRALGHAVSAKCWNDSAHCMHMKTHPKEYLGILRAFLAENAPLPCERFARL